MAYTPRNSSKQPQQPDPTPRPINPFPLIAMLVVIVFLILWIGGYLA